MEMVNQMDASQRTYISQKLAEVDSLKKDMKEKVIQKRAESKTSPFGLGYLLLSTIH
jgi:hypothetical protein